MLIIKIEKLNSRFERRDYDYERTFGTHRRREKDYS